MICGSKSAEINGFWLINTVKIKLRDQFEQTWHSLIDDSPTTNNYKLFKTYRLELGFSNQSDAKFFLAAKDITPDIEKKQ
jgi:hypothetical protein